VRVSLRAMLTVAAAGIPVTLAGVVAAPASAQPVQAARRSQPALALATNYRTAGSLTGVGAASARNAWAVGRTGTEVSEHVLLLHWNGTRWKRVTAPRVVTGAGELSAIKVVSARDAWAVGATGSDLHPRTLILHWNGTSWRAVTSPAPVANGSLDAVTATAKGGWAVGAHSTGPSVPDTSPVIFQLTGTKWKRVDPSFGTGSGVVLDGVATTSTTTFATGLYTGMITGTLAQWTGKTWKWYGSFPEEGTYHWLNAVAAGPHGVAFAVGMNTAATASEQISIRWTGHAWVKAPAPAKDNLGAVTFAPGGAAWASGSYFSGGKLHPVVLRWNGHAWSGIHTPAGSAQLYGIGFGTARNGWAVGQSVASTGASDTVILHWNGRTWS
jgi:hypothetical protein